MNDQSILDILLICDATYCGGFFISGVVKQIYRDVFTAVKWAFSVQMNVIIVRLVQLRRFS